MFIIITPSVAHGKPSPKRTRKSFTNNLCQSTRRLPPPKLLLCGISLFCIKSIHEWKEGKVLTLSPELGLGEELPEVATGGRKQAGGYTPRTICKPYFCHFKKNAKNNTKFVFFLKGSAQQNKLGSKIGTTGKPTANAFTFFLNGNFVSPLHFQSQLFYSMLLSK